METMMRTRIPIKAGVHVYPKGTEVKVEDVTNPTPRMAIFPDGRRITLVTYLELEAMPPKLPFNPAEMVVLE